LHTNLLLIKEFNERLHAYTHICMYLIFNPYESAYYVTIDAQGQTVGGGDKSEKFKNWPSSAENSKVLE